MRNRRALYRFRSSNVVPPRRATREEAGKEEGTTVTFSPFCHGISGRYLIVQRETSMDLLTSTGCRRLALSNEANPR